MTNRRGWLLAAVFGTMTPIRVLAEAKPAMIGMLSPRPMKESNYVPALLSRLEGLGYRAGSTMTLEYRSADGAPERYAKLAQELFAQKCDLIFAVGSAPAKALHDAKSPVRVVFLAIERDPIKSGIVSNLRQPDGNSTGVYIPQEEMVSKRFQILREVVPVRNLLVLSDPTSEHLLDAVRRVAGSTNVHLTVIEFARLPYDYAAAFEAGRKAGVEALMLVESPRFSTDRKTIAELLNKHRLPSMSFSVQHAEAGFLMTFSADVRKAARRAAEIGVRILKGTRTSDIPVEQVDEFEFVVNARTARALGIKMPESVLARTTRIVS